MVPLHGHGVPLDDAEAVKWFRLAAEKGDVIGQKELGLMYAIGRGVPEDFVLGYMWLYLASAKSGKDAATRREELAVVVYERRMYAEAQRMAREWKPKR